MKAIFNFRNKAAWVVIAMSVGFASAAGTAAAADAKTPAKPAAPQEIVPRKAFFSPPKSPAEGRDPFYPTSMRPFTTTAPVVQTTPTPVAVPVSVELKLKGFSGTIDRRLAIINNHTFESGEEAEVSTQNGKVMVRCVEIRNESVVVQVGSERKELHLRAGA